MEYDTGSALVDFLRNGRWRGALGANARQKNRARRERTNGRAVGPSDVRARRDAIHRRSRHSRFPRHVRILVGRLEREDRARTRVLLQHRSKAEIWITETGYSTWRHDERGQIAAFIDAMHAPAERVYWHGAHDLDSRSFRMKTNSIVMSASIISDCAATIIRKSYSFVYSLREESKPSKTPPG